MFRQWRVLFNSSDWLISVLATVFPFQMEDSAGQGGLEIGKEFSAGIK
jgi:hypothetical protein